jgi:hypothetical protein
MVAAFSETREQPVNDDLRPTCRLVGQVTPGDSGDAQRSGFEAKRKLKLILAELPRVTCRSIVAPLAKLRADLLQYTWIGRSTCDPGGGHHLGQFGA